MYKYVCLLLGIMLSVNIAEAGSKVFTTDVNKLPEISRRFIAAHFANAMVAHISIEKNFLGVKDYDVILTDGTEIEFLKSGEWKEVTRTNLSVPAEIILPSIASYVKENFTDLFIVSIEKESRKYEVKLNNGIELDFDLNGNLRKIDH